MSTSSRWYRHPAVWIFAPTAIALLYWVGHAALSANPSLSDLPPSEAVLVQRFRSLAAFDRMQPDAKPSPSARLARSLNVPNLHGIDRGGPLHLVQLPRRSAVPRSLVVLSVEDPDAVDAHFNDVGLIEKGYIRHAQHLDVSSNWAAFSPDRDVTRRLGEGGITAEDRGEDYALAAHIPGLIWHARSMPNTPPWRGLLADMGVRMTGARFVPETGSVPEASYEGLGHIERLGASWRTARMWGWFAQAGKPQVEVELAPNDGPVKDMLAGLATSPAGSALPPVPASADAWLLVPDARARAALAVAAFSLGVPFGQSADDDAKKVPAAVRALSKVSEQGDGLVVWSEPGLGGTTPVVVAAAKSGALADPTAWLPLPDVAMRTVKDYDVATGGPERERTLGRAGGTLALPRTVTVPTLPDGERLLAFVHMDAPRAQAWLGSLVGPGGLWAVFTNWAIEGTVSTDGTRLIVRLRGVGQAP